MQLVWLLIDVVAGILVAGIVAPVAVFTVPGAVRGPYLLLTIGVACVIVVSVLRRVVLGTPGARAKR